MSIKKNSLAGVSFAALVCIGSFIPAQAQLTFGTSGEGTPRGAVLLSATRAETFQNGAIRNVQGSADSQREILNDFLRDQGAAGNAPETLALVNEYVSKFGRTHLEFEQRLNGKRIHGAMVRAAFEEDGSLMSVSQRLADFSPNVFVGVVFVGPDRALEAAMQAHHPEAVMSITELVKDENLTTFSKGNYFLEDPSVEEVIIARTDGRLSTGYLVETWGAEDNMLYHTLVDGFGRVVEAENRTANDRYRIYDHYHNNSTSNYKIINGPGSGNTQSPAGWLFPGAQNDHFIRGNNVRSYLDHNNNNRPDAGGNVVRNGDFLSYAAYFVSPTYAQNQRASVHQLFYLNNFIHDELYRHGFTEARGNFQENNFNRNGRGGDSVNAETQDGGGFNNANFSTPRDGFNPRMQMYIWRGTGVDKDSAIDQDIVWHEYGHGLTWRMIGNMSGRVSGAIGEGMSDALAIIMTDDDKVGEYSQNNKNGIRSAPYVLSRRTFRTINGASVHQDGEVYAAAMWRLYEIFKRERLSRDLLMDYIIDGMNFTASGPDYISMRNGLLASFPASRDCFVWEAFSAFGMGVGARVVTSGTRVQGIESFTRPASCGTTSPSQQNLVLTGAVPSASGGGYWSARVRLTLRDRFGRAVSGVPLRYSFQAMSSSIFPPAAIEGTCTTNNAGTCTAVSPTYYNTFRPRTSPSYVPATRFRLVDLGTGAHGGFTRAAGVSSTLVVNEP